MRLALITASLAAVSLAGTACGAAQSWAPDKPPQAAPGWQQPSHMGHGANSGGHQASSTSHQSRQDSQDAREDAQDDAEDAREDAQDDAEDAQEDAQDDAEDAQEDAQDAREDAQADAQEAHESYSHHGHGRPVLIRDHGAQRTENCSGRKAIITASDADVTLNGTCPLVKITGQNTTVHVGSTSKAIVVGRGDTLRYATGHPMVINPRGNDVASGGNAKS